ncbi:MAG: hypothetical protein R3F56_01405 [Planctomycetota bacterium]
MNYRTLLASTLGIGAAIAEPQQSPWHADPAHPGNALFRAGTAA